jgi:hypothetical protein
MGLSDAISEHPLAVGAVVLFLAVQVAAFTWLLLSLRKGRAAFVKPESVGLEEPPKQDVWRQWMAWCRSEGVYAERDVVVDELTRHMDSLLGYLLLQRTSMMAPLLGVLVTAGGFLTLPSVSGSGNGVEILAAITPLAIGVGGGASLAFLGQILLLMADRTSDALHLRAMSWYDEKIAGSQPRVREAAMLLKLSGQNKEIIELLHGLATKESTTAAALESGADRLGGKLLEFSGELDSLVAVLGKATQTVGSLSPVISAMVGGFDAGVIRFQTAVTEGLLPLIGREVKHAEHLNLIADSTDRAVKNLGQTAEVLASVAQRQDDATSSYVHALEGRMIPQSDRLMEAALQIDSAAGTIGEPLSQLSDALRTFVSGLATGTESFLSLEKNAASFSDGVTTHFLPAAELQRTIAHGVSESIALFKESVSSLNSAVSDLVDAAKHHSDGSRSLQDAIEKKAVPANVLVERAAMQLGDAAESLSEHVEAYRSQVSAQTTGVNSLENTIRTTVASIGQSASSLSGSVEQLRGGPANQLHATLRSLEQASKELNASVAALRSDAERTHALTATQNDAVQLAESTIKASGEAAAQLSAASQELRSTMSGQVAERQQSLNHSVDRLSDAAKSLEGFFANDIGRLSDKVSRLDESVGELSQSMEQLDRLQKLEKHLSSLEGSLTGLGEKLDALQSLPKDLAAALQHGNGIPYPNSNGGLPVESPTPTKSWFKGT